MNTIPIDPEGCAAQILDIHGEVGREWLRQLPALIARYANQWALEVLQPFEQLSYNYVTPAIRVDGLPVVIKAGVPCDELSSEIEALQVFDGSGAVRLLDADIDSGVMLLERLNPGESLLELSDDEEITSAAISVMKQLWKPAPPEHCFRSVSDWVNGLNTLQTLFGGGTGPFPTDLVDKAQNLFIELIDPMSENNLIHGDLHPENIISARRSPWLSIDPKGVVGDPLYDIANFAGSMPQLPTESEQKRFLARRLDQLSTELGIDRKLIAKWGLVQSVLSGWWSFEDHGGGWEWAFQRAKTFNSILEG